MRSNWSWSMELGDRLHPAELGSIEIELEMTERGLEANFRATQSVTRDLLMESMPRLKVGLKKVALMLHTPD